MDLQLKLSTSKAKSTTVQDVHPDITRGMIRKTPGKLIGTLCLRPELNQSINVFRGKIQTKQFTNIYKHILFLHDIHMILVIMKTNFIVLKKTLRNNLFNFFR